MPKTIFEVPMTDFEIYQAVIAQFHGSLKFIFSSSHSGKLFLVFIQATI